jgi:hypothetical protein
MIDVNSQGNVQKSPSSKAAAFLTRGAYSQYVSTAKRRPACAKRFGEGRERRWRLFSTFPFRIHPDLLGLSSHAPIAGASSPVIEFLRLKVHASSS